VFNVGEFWTDLAWNGCELEGCQDAARQVGCYLNCLVTCYLVTQHLSLAVVRSGALCCCTGANFEADNSAWFRASCKVTSRLFLPHPHPAAAVAAAVCCHLLLCSGCVTGLTATRRAARRSTSPLRASCRWELCALYVCSCETSMRCCIVHCA
jgi:hypothetical protein